MRFDFIHVSHVVVQTKFYIWFWCNILELHNDVFGTSNFDAILCNVHFKGDSDLVITNGCKISLNLALAVITDENCNIRGMPFHSERYERYRQATVVKK